MVYNCSFDNHLYPNRIAKVALWAVNGVPFDSQKDYF